MIIIIAFKDAIRDFWPSPYCTANRVQHVRSSGPGAIVCKSRATHRELVTCNMSCYMPPGTKGQLSYLSLTEFKSHLFELYFIGWTVNRSQLVSCLCWMPSQLVLWPLGDGWPQIVPALWWEDTNHLLLLSIFCPRKGAVIHHRRSRSLKVE